MGFDDVRHLDPLLDKALCYTVDHRLQRLVKRFILQKLNLNPEHALVNYQQKRLDGLLNKELQCLFVYLVNKGSLYVDN